ncbi:MAG TPA: pirin family protein [Candidatus Nanopelagicales bacterium]|nr:pirin family protein [Candidatus Nanopelagicales bacterium]
MVEIIEPREVPLGGPRAMTVRRTLPQKRRSLVGAWCFVDHYGPDDVAQTGGMVVPPHPHTGLQTVSWLFEGEVEHRDSTGAHALVRPGEVNLMTAGHGIAHSEVSTPSTVRLHGVQLWVALPDADRETAPGFEHHVPDPIALGSAALRVFVGAYAGATSPVRAFSPLLGAELALRDDVPLRLDLDASFEHALLVDGGTVEIDDVPAAHGTLAYLSPGRVSATVRGRDGVRLLLLGGTPFGEEIVMWWNFVGRSHDDVAEQRAAWQARSARFGEVPGYVGDPSWLPAPELPHARLRPRGNA